MGDEWIENQYSRNIQDMVTRNNDFWSDEFTVINSSSANVQGAVAIILDQTMAQYRRQNLF